MYLYICNRPVVFPDRQPTQARKWGRKTRLASTAPLLLFLFPIFLLHFRAHLLPGSFFSRNDVPLHKSIICWFFHSGRNIATADVLHIDAIIGPEVLFSLSHLLLLPVHVLNLWTILVMPKMLNPPSPTICIGKPCSSQIQIKINQTCFTLPLLLDRQSW